jgi:hypothetical protein
MKNSPEPPKLWYVRIPNYSENDYVTVLNCSLIRGGIVCRRSDSSVSRAAVRYSTGPMFESRSGCTLKNNLVSKVCKGSIGRELFFREISDDSYIWIQELYCFKNCTSYLLLVLQLNPTVCWGLILLYCLTACHSTMCFFI